MVNNDRIIPIQKIDYLSMIGTVLALAGKSVNVLAPGTITGTFAVTEAGDYLANQPVQTLDFGAGAASASALFVAGYDFQGITLAGAAVEAEVKPDGVTLYKATLADGAVTVEAITPELAAE